MTMRAFRYSILALTTLVGAPAAAQFAFQKNDHIVIVGNGLPDRMQHHGWLEAHLHAAYPRHQFVIRNQGYTGDRIDQRPRNRGFMKVDEYLALSKATVVFAMFGYNESFDGKPAEFKAKIAKWIDETRQKNYSGKGAPRIVLFSPIAHEDLRSPNLPDGSSNNQRLGAYTEAMRDVAGEKKVFFVNLFSPSLRLYASTQQPLTINGIHLTSGGNHQIARVIVKALLGKEPVGDSGVVGAIRAAVLDKNLHWFNRYRATDGNDVWGGRSHLKFTDGQSNRVVLQHELVMLDIMTANRDHVVWSAAAGKTVQPDDSNVPRPVEVKTNIAKRQMQGGKSKTGSVNYLGGKEAIGKMKLAEGLQANLFASEEMFPEMVNPVQLGVDTRGRLWCAAWKTYPKWEPMKKMADRLLILPDDNRDGVADRCITFAYVHNPTGFEFWNGGVLVASAPDILFLKDTDGDDVADVRIRILGGIDSADTHHTANNFVLGPDGFLYYQRGVFHVSNVETPWRSNQKDGRSAMYRFNPRTFEFSFHATNNPNPHGVSFDYWGYHYATDGTGGRAHQVIPHEKQKGGFRMRRLLKHTVRPVPSSGILSSAHFPEKYQGNFLICNAIAFLGIKQYTMSFDTEKGHANGTETEDLLVSDDGNFRPTDFEVGDDGALYVSDWANAIVGHMQHNVRDPSRDHAHGRIYRVTVPGRPLSQHTAIDGQSITRILAALESPINGIRHRARVELSERPAKEVIAATQKWLKTWDPKNKAHAHHFLEGLWVHQQFNVKNRALLDLCLNSPEPHARVAAKRVELFWQYSAAKPAEITAEAEVAKVNKAPKDAIVIRSVMEKLQFDKKEFTVKAGQKVKIFFDNPDYMPHNLIIGMPKSTEVIAKAAEKLGAEGFHVGFVPKSDKILASTKLLNHKESQLIEFTAPKEPGNYDYLCTFPGHWMLMRGVMKVVK